MKNRATLVRWLSPAKRHVWAVAAYAGRVHGPLTPRMSFLVRALPDRSWYFAPLYKPLDNALLTVSNPGSQTAVVKVHVTRGTAATASRLEIRAHESADVGLQPSAGLVNVPKAGLVIKASRPVLVTRVVVSGSRVRTTYGMPLSVHLTRLHRQSTA